MSPTNRSARPTPRPTYFGTTEEITIGAVVFDRAWEMPATVRNILGVSIELERPTGLVWQVGYRRLRPATEREERQLDAIGRLHRQRQRGGPRT